jgi:FMN phosphatase YigB (HAD superfamily)
MILAGDIAQPRSRRARSMTAPASTVFLLDVDNTLLDNDAVEADFHRHLAARLGQQRAERYWTIFEERRNEFGYSDYLGALQRLRSAYPHEAHLLETAAYLIEYPFAERVYPGALDTVRRLNELGRTVILSDGDVVFQSHKIRRSGVWAAVDGNVLVYVHKERELDDVERRYPAEHYVIVDDKLRILDAIKHDWDSRATTVFLRQGHFTTDVESLKAYSPADVALEHIDGLVDALVGANVLPNR